MAASKCSFPSLSFTFSIPIPLFAIPFPDLTFSFPFSLTCPLD